MRQRTVKVRRVVWATTRSNGSRDAGGATGTGRREAGGTTGRRIRSCVERYESGPRASDGADMTG